MRSLEEWHKYVELQEKRASSAKSVAAAPPRPDPPEALDSNQDEPLQGEHQSNGHSSVLEDLYASPLPPDRPLVREVEPDYLRPTPLPANIEFAPDDLSDRPPDPAAHPSAPEPSPAAFRSQIRELRSTPTPAHSQNPTESVSDPAARPRVVRNGRSTVGTRKETREELLARLLDPELTLEEAAQVLNVCPTTVRRYTNRGVLPHYRTIGNQRRFRLSQVLAFLESQDSLIRSPAGRFEAEENGGDAPLNENEF